MNINLKDDNQLIQILRDFIEDKSYNHSTSKYILQFIGNSSKELIENHIINIQLSTVDTNILRKIWKELIIDAINFLRLNDGRERSFGALRSKENINKTQRVRSLNAYGVSELYEYFKEFTDFETILYGADEFYRDHVQHPLVVWLIGLNILHGYIDCFKFQVSKHSVISPSPNSKLSYSRKNSENINTYEVSSAEIGAMWTIVALCHDLGYPLQKVDRINNQLEKMLKKFGRVSFQASEFSFGSQHSFLVEQLLTILSSSLEQVDDRFITHIRPKFLTKFSKSWEMFDHGIVSSLILFRSLNFFLETDLGLDVNKSLDVEDARQFSIRAEMLHAIASHTTSKVYHILANNLAFLLLLCDDLHEWGRPTLIELMNENSPSGALNVIISHINIQPTESSIECYIKYPKLEHNKQKKQVMRIFKSWHERLRPAVDDDQRKMKFVWKIEYEGTPINWEFNFNTRRKVLDELEVTGPDDNNPPQKIPYEDIYMYD